MKRWPFRRRLRGPLFAHNVHDVARIICLCKTMYQVTELSSKLKDTDELLARKQEMLDMETRRLQLAQKRLDAVKTQQKALKRKRDSLKDAKSKFESQESDASNRASRLKVIIAVDWVVLSMAACVSDACALLRRTKSATRAIR
jgi:hypothetical protein